MKLSIRCISLLALAVVALTAAARPATSQSQAPVADVRLDDLGFSDVRVTGVATTQSLFFPGPGDWDLADGGSFLVIAISHSTLLKPEHSTMTVSFNGTLLRATRLDASNAERTLVSLPIPASLIQRDLNEVRLAFNLRLSDCEGADDNPARFAVVHKDSGIRYQYSPRTRYALQDFTLASFPYPFFRSGYLRLPPTAVVVPPQPNEAELSAAVQVGAHLGRFAGSANPDVRLITADAFSDTTFAGHHLILIGTPSRNPLVARFGDRLPVRARGQGDDFALAAGGTALPTTYGVLTTGRSALNPERAVLLVSGNSEAGLRRAARTFIANDETNPLRGSYAVIAAEGDEQPDTAATPASGKRDERVRVSFAESKLKEISVSGYGPQRVSVPFVSLPPSSDQAPELVLSLAHSELLDTDNSSLRVELNGAVVSSVRLKAKNGERQTMRFKLPADKFTYGRNEIVLLFTLVAPRATSDASTQGRAADPCASSGPPAEQLWAVVYPESYIELSPNRGGARLDLSLLPFPFAENADNAPTYIVTSDSATALDQTFQLAMRLGSSTSRPAALFAVRSADLTASARDTTHLIAIGLPSENAVMRAANPALPLRFESQGNRPLAEQGRALVNVLNDAALAVVEESASPWNPMRALLIIAATNDEALPLARRAITANDLKGNVAIVSRDLVRQAEEAEGRRPALESAPERPIPGSAVATFSLGDGGAARLAGEEGDGGLNVRLITAIGVIASVILIAGVFVTGIRRTEER